MICFRDMTFCSSDCAFAKCTRHFGPAESAASKAWWGSDDVPVAFSDFSENCEYYEPPHQVGDRDE